MTNLVTLQDKVTAMLEGEKKRREIALKFISELQEILEPVAETVWGSGEVEESGKAAWIRNKIEGQNKKTGYYFRYGTYSGSNNKEYIGFYEINSMYGLPLWGNDLTDLKGADFWNAIRSIVNWISVLIETIDNRNNSRDKLISLVNI